MHTFNVPTTKPFKKIESMTILDKPFFTRVQVRRAPEIILVV